MAAIFAQMRSNTIGARFFCHDRSPYRIRHSATPRVSYSRNMIDIYAKAQIIRLHHKILF